MDITKIREEIRSIADNSPMSAITRTRLLSIANSMESVDDKCLVAGCNKPTTRAAFCAEHDAKIPREHE